jgi:hypothetical protein
VLESLKGYIAPYGRQNLHVRRIRDSCWLLDAVEDAVKVAHAVYERGFSIIPSTSAMLKDISLHHTPKSCVEFTASIHSLRALWTLPPLVDRKKSEGYKVRRGTDGKARDKASSIYAGIQERGGGPGLEA